ncbi:hypothetical protein [Nocardiopsis aegyptia]|uniref:DUF3558 domain-containing protein n=1 Tax=Nocardiopsis aegyptia TaxID=220378 RepID=A0A7Z0ENG6_9ACTN|nr:hypothetical protein [Nocardiopsis aegyptia]NYJ35360.1 hypothetical protein [Nocardiopsis aegyptia]
MYDGPAQQFPQPQAVSAPPPPRRGGTGRTVAITAAATLAAYTVVAGVVVAMNLTSDGGGMAGPEPEYDELPAEPCTAASRDDLGALSARMPSASFAAESSSCAWQAEFSDGSFGHLRVGFRLPTDGDSEPRVDESAAEGDFEVRRGELVDGTDEEYWTLEVLESRELDIADEAVVSHFREGSFGETSSRAEVLVRVESVLVTVSASEPWEQRSGSADYTGDEEVLVSVAERAVTLLE